ncbi:MAG: SPOR domain-containing protein [Phaeodactylibacter sp.]|nr:SPOR domain-containing protein [Phaeodactylibacter sp.]
MSRLDYVTIAIVAVCVAALVYLIYMTTNLLGEPGSDSGTTTEVVPPGNNEDAGDDTYYFNEENKAEDIESQGDAGSADAGSRSDYDYQNEEGSDKEPSSSGTPSTAPSSTSEQADTRSSSVAREEYTARGGATSGSPASSASGDFMVMAGTFTVKAYAQDMEKKLRSMGYNNVILEPFDRGKYTVVMVDRFSSLSSAQSLVSELKSKGVDSYVKRK